MKVWPPNGHLSQWILEQFPTGYKGWGLDVGASDGISINTTFALEKHHGWTIVSVEANPDFYPALKHSRAMVEKCALGSEPKDSVEFHIHEQNPEAFSSLKPQVRPHLHPQGDMSWKKVVVPVRTANQVLDKWEFPRLDLLAVDTEGTELDVLMGCDLEKWKPKVVIVESWDGVEEADKYLESRGYKLVARNIHNNLHLRIS